MHVVQYWRFEKNPRGMLFCEGLRILARTRKLVRLLLRRKATIGADLKTLWQRWNEVKTLACLRMMDEVERRAHPCSLFFSFVFKELALIRSFTKIDCVFHVSFGCCLHI